MYVIDTDGLVDRVDLDSLEDNALQKVKDALAHLATNAWPDAYACKPQPDGSYQISIPIGLRRLLLGYEVDGRHAVILLNYLKWDWLREALDWTVGLLGNEPGGKK